VRQRLVLHMLVETVVSTINTINLLSFFSFTYFSPSRGCPRNFSIKVLAKSENSKTFFLLFF
jgi:hypothetical protein